MSDNTRRLWGQGTSVTSTESGGIGAHKDFVLRRRQRNTFVAVVTAPNPAVSAAVRPRALGQASARKEQLCEEWR